MSRTALVIGAGVAGSVAAIALIEAGWDAEVFEADEQPAGLAQGAFLTLAVNGLHALGAVRADHVARDLGFAAGQIRFVSARGKDLGAMASGPVLADGTSARTVPRARLYAGLSGLAERRGARFHHGRRLITARSRGDGVEAVFAGGATATGDVLIGADGVGSTVRAVIDPDAPAPAYTGMANVGALTPPGRVDTAREAADGDYRMIWGRRCVFGYTVTPEQEVWWYASPPARRPLAPGDPRATDTAALRSGLTRLLAVDQSPAAEIVAATEGPILVSNQWEMAPVPRWHRDRMIIIADAAHAVSPATGQGVSLACEDAVTLAGHLRDQADIAAAFAGYETDRRERVHRITEMGAMMGGTKALDPFGRVVRDLFLPRILGHLSAADMMTEMSWLYDHRIDWPADRRP